MQNNTRMKISNETKVGALTAIAIVILILGFNYLKGRNVTDRSDEIYAVFPSVKGVQKSNAVMINGLQVGKVTDLKEKDKNLSGIVVTITLTKNINIPRNSVIGINSELLSSTSLDIALGDAPEYVQDGDTLAAVMNQSLLGELTKSINPAIDNANKTLSSLDILIRKLSAIVDTTTQLNIQGIVRHLSSTTRSLDMMVSAQNGVLLRSLNNVESITGNLAKNNDQINSTIANLDKTSSKLAEANIEEMLQSVKATMTKLQSTVDNFNSKNGTMGLLLNDRQLYDELRQTNRSLTILLDDLRVNPKRYVNISVFGKKQKQQPLMTPIYDSVASK
jgi:phospholipid/cholesterol/gamma-HCH transport system substrate-binding protein